MKEGKAFWEGEAAETAYIGDAPDQIVLEAKPEGIALQAIDPSGAIRWQLVLKGIPASWTLEPSEHTAALLFMPGGWTQAQDKAQEATLVAVDTRDGALRWSLALPGIIGSVDSFGSEIAIGAGGVWWAAGGRAARVELSSGRLTWSEPIPQTQGPNSLWALSGPLAAAARGDRLFLFDAATGLKWERQLLKGGWVSGLFWTKSGLLAKFQHEEKLVLAQLDPQTGKSRWEHALKHRPGKFQGPPPEGMVVTERQVFVAPDVRLHAYDLETGAELLANKMERNIQWKAQAATNIRQMQARKEHFVIFGRTDAAAFSLKDGSPLWRKEGYEPPQDVVRRMRQAGLSVAFQSYHHLSPSYTSPAAAAEARAAGHYGAGSWQHQSMMNTAENLQYQYAMSQGAAQGSSASDWVAKIAEIELQLKNERMPANYAAFYKLLGMKLFAIQNSDKVAAVLLDLDSGADTEIKLPDSATGCVSQVILDPAGKRMLLTYQQLALLCKDEDLVEAYRLP